MPIMNTGALLALVDGFAPAGTPDMGMVADPLTSHAEAGPEEVVSSLGSQPEGGRAFVRHTPQTRRTLRETPRRPLASSIRAFCAPERGATDPAIRGRCGAGRSDALRYPMSHGKDICRRGQGHRPRGRRDPRHQYSAGHDRCFTARGGSCEAP